MSKCNDKQCDKDAVESFKYCKFHKCLKKACPNKSRVRSSYCERHRPGTGGVIRRKIKKKARKKAARRRAH